MNEFFFSFLEIFNMSNSKYICAQGEFFIEGGKKYFSCISLKNFQLHPPS
jgi:hypothetical protein